MTKLASHLYCWLVGCIPVLYGPVQFAVMAGPRWLYLICFLLHSQISVENLEILFILSTVLR